MAQTLQSHRLWHGPCQQSSSRLCSSFVKPLNTIVALYSFQKIIYFLLFYLFSLICWFLTMRATIALYSLKKKITYYFTHLLISPSHLQLDILFAPFQLSQPSSIHPRESQAHGPFLYYFLLNVMESSCKPSSSLLFSDLSMGDSWVFFFLLLL